MVKRIKSDKLYNILTGVNLIMMVIGVMLGVTSSNMAYSLSQINLIIIAGILVVILDIIALILSNRFGCIIFTDIIHLITILLSAAALSMMIKGRVLLMGYVYFSDLEKGNPMAVSAMNIAIISWVILLMAIVSNIWIGFVKKSNVI